MWGLHLGAFELDSYVKELIRYQKRVTMDTFWS